MEILNISAALCSTQLSEHLYKYVPVQLDILGMLCWFSASAPLVLAILMAHLVFYAAVLAQQLYDQTVLPAQVLISITPFIVLMVV